MKIEKLISDIKQLPPSPEILPKLQQLLADEDSSLDDITRLIRLDPALTAQIIKVSNSVYYGGSTACESIDQAINRVGFNEVFKLVGMIVTRQILGNALPIYNHDIGHLWESSIMCGMLMFDLAPTTDINRETAYTIGLLHGLGKVVINAYHREHGIPGYEENLPEMNMLWEQENLGFTNADVSAALLEKWAFDPEIRLPIAYQAKPHLAPQGFNTSAYLLYVSRTATKQVEEQSVFSVRSFEIEEDILEYLEIGAPLIVENVLNARNQVRTLISSI